MSPARKFGGWTRLGLVTAVLVLSAAAEPAAADGGGRDITIDVPAPQQRVVTATAAVLTEPPAGTDAHPGDTLRGYWTGVAPTGTWRVWLMPTGLLLGATEVGATGRADYEVTLPGDLAPGSYALELVQAYGTAAGDVRIDGEYVVQPTVPVTVVARPDPSAFEPPSAGAPPRSRSPQSSETPGPSAEPTASATVPQLPNTGGDDTGVLHVSGVTARYLPTANPLRGAVSVELTVRNGGTVAVVGSARAWVTGPFGKELGAPDTAELTRLAPGATRTLAFTVDDVGQAFQLVAYVTLTPKPAPGADPATADELHEITREASVMAVPWLPVSLLALAAAAPGVAVVLRRRRRLAVAPPTLVEVTA